MNTTTCDVCGKEIHFGEWAYCPHEPYRQGRFTPVEVDLGKLGKHTIDGIQSADRLQKMAAEHGQQIVFRAFNNDPSNQDRNSLGENRQTDFKTRNRRGVPFISRRGVKG
jgi:hypothetical protein